jgi:Mce-associated membrane protein
MPYVHREAGPLTAQPKTVVQRLPALALLPASAAAFLKWQDAWVRDAAVARTESVQATRRDTGAAVLAARHRAEGSQSRAGQAGQPDRYVPERPGSTTEADLRRGHRRAARLDSATDNHAVVLLFVNQTVIVGQSAPTNTASSVRLTLDKINGRWLISQFDPV